MKKFYIILAMLISATLALTGCSQTPKPSDEANVVVADEEPTSGEGEENEAQGPIFENVEMGFRVELPMLLKDKMTEEITTTEINGEVVTTATIYYTNESDTVSVISFEEMSETLWKQMQNEGGPLGRELGISDEGRAVIMNSLQSNPFAEGTEDFELFNQFPMQLKVVDETFKFLK